VLLAQDFVALLDRLPTDLIGVALAAAGGYFLWLKFTAYVDAQMNDERARCDKEIEDLKTGQGELKGEIRAMRVWRDLAWWLRSECIRLGATEADLEQHWPKEDQ
jgi:hypothetical protein